VLNNAEPVSRSGYSSYSNTRSNGSAHGPTEPRSYRRQLSVTKRATR